MQKFFVPLAHLKSKLSTIVTACGLGKGSFQCSVEELSVELTCLWTDKIMKKL